MLLFYPALPYSIGQDKEGFMSKNDLEKAKQVLPKL